MFMVINYSHNQTTINIHVIDVHCSPRKLRINIVTVNYGITLFAKPKNKYRLHNLRTNIVCVI